MPCLQNPYPQGCPSVVPSVCGLSEFQNVYKDVGRQMAVVIPNTVHCRMKCSTDGPLAVSLLSPEHALSSWNVPEEGLRDSPSLGLGHP